MKNFHVLFTTVLLGVLSCNINESEPSVEEFSLESLQDTVKFNEFIEGEWEIVMAEGMFLGGWLTGDDLPFRETLIFETENGTFTKTNSEYEGIIAKGTWSINYYQMANDRKSLMLYYGEGLETVINCYPEPEMEEFYITAEGQLLRACTFEPNEGGQRYYFEKVE